MSFISSLFSGGQQTYETDTLALLTDNTSQILAFQPLEPASPGAWPWCGVSDAEETLVLGVAGIT